MKKAAALSFIVYLFSSFLLFAQKNSIPAIDTLIAKSERFLDVNTDSMLRYAFKAAELSQLKKSSYYIAKSYIAIGNVYDKLENFDTQIAYLQKAKNAASLTSDERLKMKIAVGLAEALYNKGKMDEALSLSRKTQSMILFLHDSDLLYKIYFLQGTVYLHEEKQNLDSAYYYFDKTLRIASAKHDTSEIADSYRRLNAFYFMKHQMDQAVYYTNKAMELYTMKHNIEGLAITYKELGNIY